MNIPQKIGKKLSARSLSLSVAESCTAGILSAMITTVPGSSRYFTGGVVAYDNLFKKKLLGVSQETLDQEREIGREQALREGRPENIVDKIAEGKLQKFFKDSTLLNQDFTKDNKKTVRQYLQEADKSLTVKAFRRYSLNL